VLTSKREHAREHPATVSDRSRSAAPESSGRQRCMRKCAAIHKGYVYRAAQHLEGSASGQIEPEVCSCI
jgi:hypothetical protein